MLSILLPDFRTMISHFSAVFCLQWFGDDVKFQGSLKMSSHASHNINRGVAKVAVDVVALSGMQKLQVTEIGKKFVTLQGDFGDDEYDRLCSTPGLALLTINYCQRGMQQLADPSIWGSLGKLSKESTSATPAQLLQAPGVESVKSLKGLINHDYLVVEIQPGDPNIPIFYIVAQKLSGEKPGIHISSVLLEKKDEVLDKGVIHYSIDCRNKQIPLKTLIETLKEGDPHYSLRNANCWDYATAAAKRLVKECAHVPGISPEEMARLEKEHDDLEANLAKNSICSTIKVIVTEVPSVLLIELSSGSVCQYLRCCVTHCSLQ